MSVLIHHLSLLNIFVTLVFNLFNLKDFFFFFFFFGVPVFLQELDILSLYFNSSVFLYNMLKFNIQKSKFTKNLFHFFFS